MQRWKIDIGYSSVAPQPPYDAVLLVKSDDPHVIEALRPMIGAIDVATMRQANLMVDREEDKRTVPEAAAWLKGQLRR